MKKRTSSVLLSLALVLLAVFFLNNKKVLENVDNLVLLEKRHPGYWEYLRPELMTDVQMLPGFEEVSTEKIKAGNVLRNFIQGNYSGVDISFNNGVMHFKGTATENIWPGIADTSDLTTGTYFISAGNEYAENAVVYFEGIKGEEHHTFAILDDPSFIYIDKAQYDDFKFTVGIKNGNAVDFSLKPVLYKISDKEIGTETIHVWRDVPIDISEDDLNVFKHRQSGTIIFQDGSAKQYDGQWADKVIDEFGRIIST